MSAPVLAAMGPTALWYLTRATGIVALVLLTGVVVLGVITTRGWANQRWPRFAWQAIHRNLSLYCLLLIGVHIVTTVVDGFAPISFLDAVVPFRSPYRPLWLGLGTLSFDLLLVLAVTSLLRHRIGFRLWKGIHWLAYASWPVAVLHGLGTGTDTSLGPVLLLNVVCAGAVLWALGWRLADGWPAMAGRRVAAGAGAALFAFGSAVFVVVGPLRPGWSKRAGTPTSLVASSAAAAKASGAGGSGSVSGSATSTVPPPSSGSVPAALPAPPFSGTVSGSVVVSQPDSSGQVTLEVRGQLGSGLSGPFEIELIGQPEDGGVAMSTGTVSVDGSSGPVVGLEGSRIIGNVTSRGFPLEVAFRLRIDQLDNQVTGIVEGLGGGVGGFGSGT